MTNRHLKFENSIWPISFGGSKRENSLDWNENYYSGVFEVADCKSLLEISKFKMADPICQIYLIEMKIITLLRPATGSRPLLKSIIKQPD